jgi:hypothetical protein
MTGARQLASPGKLLAKLELIINLETDKVLDFTTPPSLLPARTT